jgi:hypothetical protein
VPRSRPVLCELFLKGGENIFNLKKYVKAFSLHLIYNSPANLSEKFKKKKLPGSNRLKHLFREEKFFHSQEGLPIIF